MATTAISTTNTTPFRGNFVNKSRAKPEKNEGKKITTTAGYIPLKTQFERIIESGKSIQDYYGGLYDTYADQNGNIDFEGEIASVLNPTRRKDFDLADYSELKKNVTMRAQNRTKEKADRDSRKAELLSMRDSIIKDSIAAPPEGSGEVSKKVSETE